MLIKTSNDFPPIPIRNYDWSAHDDDKGSDSSAVGHGSTEEEAVEDFIDQVHEDALWRAFIGAQMFLIEYIREAKLESASKRTLRDLDHAWHETQDIFRQRGNF